MRSSRRRIRKDLPRRKIETSSTFKVEENGKKRIRNRISSRPRPLSSCCPPRVHAHANRVHARRTASIEGTTRSIPFKTASCSPPRECQKYRRETIAPRPDADSARAARVLPPRSTNTHLHSPEDLGSSPFDRTSSPLQNFEDEIDVLLPHPLEPRRFRDCVEVREDEIHTALP